MQGISEEDETKGLEAEIDSAIDRFFVDKNRHKPGIFQKKSSLPEDELFLSRPSNLSDEKKVGPSPLLESLDKMETHLLSLEWEITKENLRRTKEEVVALRENSREKPDVTRVVGLMERVLDRMIRREGDIRPSMIKFLLDAKDTVRLLLRQEIDGEINIYHQLA